MELIGRETELDVAVEAWGAVLAGGRRVLAVVGEPGIGKSALLAAIAGRVRDAPALVLEARAAEHERDVPFGLVADLLDDAIVPGGDAAAGGADALRAAVSGTIAGLGKSGGAAERFRRHRALRGLLERLAAERPLALLLDDLHWGDDASLELVLHLLRRPPGVPHLLVLAARPGTVAARLLDAARGGPGLAELALGPLGRDASLRLLRGLPDGVAHSSVVREAGGNPLFLRELARAGGAPGTGLPGTLIAAVAGELARLPAGARRLAEGAAVAGDPFDLDVAAAAAGHVPADPTALDALAAAGLVGASGEGREFAFRHALVRRAVYDAAPPAWRLAAHERAAQALARRGAPLAVRAYHVTRCARPGDERAIALLAEAAAGSRDTAPAAAAHWYGAAARLLPDADDRRGSLVARRALALAEAGRLEQSEAALLEALALAGAAQGAERARLETACARMQAQLGRHAEARHRLRAAFARCGGNAAAEVALHLAADAMSRDRPGELRTWAGHVARSAGDGRPMLQAAAQALTALARIVDGDVDRGAEVAAFDRAVARMDALDDATVAADLDAALQIGRAQLRLQRAAGAAATFTRALDVCRRAHRGELVVHLLAVRTIARWLLLDLDGALADATAVEEGARLYGGSHQVLLATWLLALVHHHRGEVAEAERAAGAFTPLAASLPTCEPVRAGACTLATIPVDRDPERCVREILELGGADLEHAEHGWAGSALPALVRAAVATGRTEEAEQWAALATGRTLNLPANEVRAALARAEVRLARGEAGAAAGLATRAATVADAIPAPLDAAEARLLAGRALAAAGRPEEAKRALQRVAADAGRGRAGRLHHQAARELRRLGTRVSGPGRRVAHQPLSPRERRIADLVAGGSANKEVAAALFLSPKTVENALTRIYAKLGIRERRELPRALAAPSS